MTLDEWAALLHYWKAGGHDIAHLDIPPEITEQLNNPAPDLPMPEPLLTFSEFEALVHRTYGGVQNLPQNVRNEMYRLFCSTAAATVQREKAWYEIFQPNQSTRTEMMPPETAPDDQRIPDAPPNDSTAKDAPKWKRKAYFDGTECGYSGCSRPADGYVSGTKPTKGGARGALWFGPACTACVRKWHPSLQPITLAELAYQRQGASDLALVLDVEVGDVLRRLALAGIDERGQPFQSNAQAYAVGQEASGVALATTTNGTFVAVAPVEIPVQVIQTKIDFARGVLQQLAPWHIMSQQDMDYASSFLAQVKGTWKELEEQRKAIAKPLRDKIQTVQDYFKPPLELLEQVETVVKQKIADGAKRAQAAQQAAYEAAQRALQAGDAQASALAASQAVAADITLAPTVGIRTVFVGEIVDYAQLPQDFWSWVPDPTKVQAAVDAGYREIPGCRVYEKSVVSSKSA